MLCYFLEFSQCRDAERVHFSLISRKLDRTEILNLHGMLLIRLFNCIQVRWNHRVNFHCNIFDVYPCLVNTVCKKITLTLSRREKHAIMLRNRQQNMTLIGIKLEEVPLLQNKKRSLRRPTGVPRPMGIPSRYLKIEIS